MQYLRNGLLVDNSLGKFSSTLNPDERFCLHHTPLYLRCQWQHKLFGYFSDTLPFFYCQKQLYRFAIIREFSKELLCGVAIPTFGNYDIERGSPRLKSSHAVGVSPVFGSGIFDKIPHGSDEVFAA